MRGTFTQCGLACESMPRSNMDGSNYLQARWDADLSMEEVLNGSAPRLPRDASGIVRMEVLYLPSSLVIKSGLLVAPVFDPLLPTTYLLTAKHLSSYSPYRHHPILRTFSSSSVLSQLRGK